MKQSLHTYNYIHLNEYDNKKKLKFGLKIDWIEVSNSQFIGRKIKKKS